MRLIFPNGEHATVDYEPGQWGVGSATGGGTRIVLPGLAPLHAVFAGGRKGHWLTVPGEARVVVNARPVRRLAHLRAGDLICLSGVQVRLESTEVPPPAPAIALRTALDDRARRDHAVLRGLNGDWFGRCLPLAGLRLLGRAAECELRIDVSEVLPRHLLFECDGKGWIVRAATPAATFRVNGHLVDSARLGPGDQIEVGEQRFLFESAAAQAALLPPVESAPMQTSAVVGVQPAGRDFGNALLLIAVASALAAALLALLVYAPRG